jgi:hypothetical protein
MKQHLKSSNIFFTNILRFNVKNKSVGNCKTMWGDLDPATKQISGNYGKKYRGGIDPEESLISEENGFLNVVTLDIGTSPLLY